MKIRKFHQEAIRLMYLMAFVKDHMKGLCNSLDYEEI